MNTPSKRASAIGIGLAVRLVLPVPDGAVEAGDRQHVAYCYAGGAGAPVVPVVPPVVSPGAHVVTIPSFPIQRPVRRPQLPLRIGGSEAVVPLEAVGAGRKIGQGGDASAQRIWAAVGARKRGRAGSAADGPQLHVEGAGLVNDADAILRLYAESLIRFDPD